MAWRDSARQGESIDTTLVTTGGILTPKQQVLLLCVLCVCVGGGAVVVVPSRGALGDFRAWCLALCFPLPW